MAISNTYTVKGFPFTFIAGDWEDGILIQPDTDVTQDGFLDALRLAQLLHPDFYEYGLALNHYDIYYPSPRRFFEKWVEDARSEFVAILHQSSIEVHTRHQRRYAETESKKPKPAPGYIYLIRAVAPDNHYKIGLSREPVKRIESMGVLLPFPIEPIHQFPTNHMTKAERQLHGQYADKRLNGEWFALSEQDVRDICAIERMDIEGVLP